MCVRVYVCVLCVSVHVSRSSNAREPTQSAFLDRRTPKECVVDPRTFLDNVVIVVVVVVAGCGGEARLRDGVF